MTSDDATTELLAALDELYPLPDDDKRVERAGRTAAVLKRWMAQEEVNLATAAAVILKRKLVAAQASPPTPDAECLGDVPDVQRLLSIVHGFCDEASRFKSDTKVIPWKDIKSVLGAGTFQRVEEQMRFEAGKRRASSLLDTGETPT